MTLRRYVTSITIGWLLLGLLFWIYVIRQNDLISDRWELFWIVACGSLIGFVFSALETALLKCNDRHAEKFTKERETNEKLRATTTLPEEEYKKVRKKLDAFNSVYSRRDYHVAPLVIFSNVAAFVSTALLSTVIINGISMGKNFSLGMFGEFIGVPSFEVPWAGSRMLSICSSAIVLLIIGKIIPKKLASEEACMLWLITKCAWLIRSVSRLFGFLGVAINAPADLALRIVAGKKPPFHQT